MYKRILDVVDSYSKKKKLLDDKAIEKIFSIIKYENNLGSLVNSIKVDHINDKTAASYLIESKKIVIDPGLILTRVYNDDYYAKNLQILISLLHEMEHVNQRKMINKSYKPTFGEETEREILKYALNFIRYKDKSYVELTQEERSYLEKLDIGKDKFKTKLSARQKSYYNIDPAERLAQIKALKQAKMILSLTNRNDLYNGLGELYQKELLRGYRRPKGALCFYSPTYEFMRAMGFEGKIGELHEIEDEHRIILTNDRRLELGINVPDKEIIRRLKG